MDERKYWLGFSMFSGIGPVTFKKLYSHFGSAKAVWHADVNDILKLNLGEKLVTKFDQFRNGFSITDYTRLLLVKKISFVTQIDKEYPELLKQIKNPPIVLYVRGNLDLFYSSTKRSAWRSSSTDSSRQARTINPIIAVVGTRRISEYGKEVTQQFTQELVEHGFTIVSGLAFGVDAIAHETTIENNGKTIAVLGCGIECCTPAENQSLYNSIVRTGGAVISELPLSHPPTKGSFPSRNRIIAGLSLGVVVTEGAEDSGALITADYAYKFNRKVFAVPGPITSDLSKGPYKLIAKGAKLVTSAQDIVSELGINKSIKGIKSIKSIKGGTKEEEKILELLQGEPLYFDQLVKQTGIHSAKLGSILSMMEIKGMIKNQKSGTFSINQ